MNRLFAMILAALLVAGCNSSNAPTAASRDEHGHERHEDGDYAGRKNSPENDHENGHDIGHDIGHENDHESGHEDRREGGHEDGLDDGHEDGPEDGHEGGLDDRHRNGNGGGEGRTTIAADVAQTMGVATTEAGPATLKETLSLSGVIQADPARVSRVRARFPGVVRKVAVQPWSMVRRGAMLAQVQSNESLQNYSITAPISGVLVEHRAQVGEATGEEALFTIVDLSKVWVELDVFQTDLARIGEQQPVRILDLEGRKLADGHLSRIAPLAVHGSQSVRARVVMDNAKGDLRPGQFVTAHVTVAETQVPLAVRREALQRFRDADVVFEQIGDTYHARMLELGRGDADHIEVVAGLQEGDRYVTRNSYLIKADIEKAGAGHDH